MSDTQPVEPAPPAPDPGAFGPGSHAPASGVLSLKDQLKAGVGTAKPRATRAKATTTKAAPTVRRPPPAPTPADEAEAERARKAARVDELSDKLTGEWNDELMRVFISAGMPSHWIYKPGKAPEYAGDQGKFTEVGMKLSIKPFMASSLAHFAAEVEQSKVGQSVVGTATGGPLGMLIYGAATVISVGMYVQDLRGVMKRLEELRMVAAAAEQQKAQAMMGVGGSLA